MDFPIHIDAISIKLPIVYFKGSQVVFLCLKVILILAKSADPDEMQHYAAFHLGLHCLPNYPFRVSRIQRFKSQISVLNFTLFNAHFQKIARIQNHSRTIMQNLWLYNF